MPALIARPARPWAVGVAVAAALVFLVLAAIVWGRTSTRPDTWAARHALADFGALDARRRRVWLLFSEPAVSVAVPTAVGLWALVTRRWRVLALAALGPSVALALAEIGKVVIGRKIGPGTLLGGAQGVLTGSYPSGHETGTVAWLTLLVVLVLRLRPARREHVAALVIAVGWALLAAFGLTINFYHYASDTLGAIGSTVAVMLGTALAVDAVADRRVS